MITYASHKEPERVIRNAVLDDIAPIPVGSEVEYWVGETDLDPIGKRKSVFSAVMALFNLNRIVLYQVKQGELYSYRFKVSA